jgi:transcriptional regulator GlxA family with amidase domain
LPLTVDQLAEQAAMSPRNFARLFAAETGATPAKAIERLRVEAARALLDSQPLQVEDVALETGFGDQERMRRAFLRAFGQPPQALRLAVPTAVTAAPHHRTHKVKVCKWERHHGKKVRACHYVWR